MEEVVSSILFVSRRAIGGVFARDDQQFVRVDMPSSTLSTAQFEQLQRAGGRLTATGFVDRTLDLNCRVADVEAVVQVLAGLP